MCFFAMGFCRFKNLGPAPYLIKMTAALRLTYSIPTCLCHLKEYPLRGSKKAMLNTQNQGLKKPNHTQSKSVEFSAQNEKRGICINTLEENLLKLG